MIIISVLIFAVAANFDNLVVGISFGIKKIHISILANLIIAFISFTGTFLSMSLGKATADYFPIVISNIFGGVIIIAIGMASLTKYIQSKKYSPDRDGLLPLKNSEKYDKNSNKRIDFIEAISLGIALSTNNIGLGIGASITGLPIWLASICSFFISIIFIFIGNLLGNKLMPSFIQKYAELIAAVSIIILGLCEIII